MRPRHNDFTPMNSRKSKFSAPTMQRAALASVMALAACSVHAQTRDLSKGNTLYVIPYAHLDTQWRWAYPQVIREYIANTLTRNFDLIDKYPTYVFNFSGSRRYEMMKEYYPSDYERLKGYIKAGRWFPCGSSVDEGDANVPSSESLIRHVLYGNRYFRKEFGVASEEFMLPDCFGFPYALPSILVHCGLKGFSTQKLTWGSPIGIPFKVGNWVGPDGKSIVAALDPGAYSARVEEDLSQNTSWLARIQNTGKKSGAFVDYHYYGTGDQGGSPTEGSVNWVEKAVHGTGPVNVVSAKADEMFKSLTMTQIANLPKYQGELLLTQHSAGSITSQAYMKRWNRKNELAADAAERASVAAAWLGSASYPAQRLYTAWDLMLGSQMHDMLPGTSIPKAYEFCWNDENLASNQFRAITKDAVGAVTSAMNTRTKGQPVVVYNPLSIAREDVVEATISATSGAVQVYGPDGNPVPTQMSPRNGSKLSFKFLAKVPANGFATFDARLTTAAAVGSTLFAQDNTISSPRFKVTVNAAGDIASIYDKAARREVLKAPARLDFQYHNPSQFPAWNMDWADAKLAPTGYVTGPAKIRITETGPVRVTLEVERETAGSKFVQQISLSAGSAGDRVEVKNIIDWQTKERALKASFPLTTGNPEATYDLQLGAIRRGNNNPNRYEVPQHQWFDLTKADNSYGVGILNDCKFGSDKPDDDTVRLTLLYTPGVRGGFADQSTQDFGRHEITYAIAPHRGDWQQGGVEWQAKRLNQPLKAFVVPAHDGPLGKTFSLISSSSSQVEIQAIKKAEASDEIIVRLRELEGRPANNVRIMAANGIVAAREVNGQEMPIQSMPVQSGTVTTSVIPFGLKSFAIRLGKSIVAGQKTSSIPVPLNYDLDVASTDKHPSDGSFDQNGLSISAELLPKSLTVADIQFQLGSTVDGAKNALSAKGQTIKLPAGFSKVYVLAASVGDTKSNFQIGNRLVTATIQDWSGYIGQWDNRSWQGDLGPNFSNYGEMNGLSPAYEKPSEVAWYGSHRHDASSGNTFYDYSYLYKYSFDIPAGATSITLPNNPNVRIMAISVAKNVHDDAQAVQPNSERAETGAPGISPASGNFNDATKVTLSHSLYWQEGRLHYTIDGSIPSANSSTYKGPFMLSRPTTVKVAEISSQGVGPVATATINVNDTTPPSVVAVTSPLSLGLVRVQFSEAVTAASAEDPAHYSVGSDAKVVSASLGVDQKTVDLTLDRPLASGESLTVTGVRDISIGRNTLGKFTGPITEQKAIFTSPELDAKKAKTFNVPGLPVKGHDAWTLNLFCKVDAMPEDRTMIAGFGRARDGRSGTGRYFTKFAEGINFWVANSDVHTTVPMDLGKWQMLTATYDGSTMRLYKNGELIAEQEASLSDDSPNVQVMPLDAWERKRQFDGNVRNLTVWNQDLSSAAVKRLWETGKRD